MEQGGEMISEGPAASDDFASELRKLVPDPCRDRPFECDGLPQDCEVMLIGENPATGLGGDFNWWDHWSDATGFNNGTMAEVYEKERAQPSNTHKRIGILKEELRKNKVRLLVTNVYRNGRPDGSGPGAARNVEVIRLLLAHMPRLAVVIVHGKRAQRKITSRDLRAGVFYRAHWHFAPRGKTTVQIEECIEALAVEALGFVRARRADVA
jgi:hypothetical protein